MEMTEVLNITDGTNANSSIVGSDATTKGDRQVAVVTTIVFALIEILTNGGLLLLLLALRRKVGRYSSFIQNAILLNVVIKALLDLTMRLPLFILGSDTVPPAVCVALSIPPDYTMLAILLTLPLISAERLVKLWVKPTYCRRKIRRVFIAVISAIYITALVVTLLPASSLFATSDDVNVKCGGYLTYGYGFAHIYLALTVLSVLLAITFSISTTVLLRYKLQDVEVTATRKGVIKRGVISAFVMTFVLFVATVPFALVFQRMLSCQGPPTCQKKFAVSFRICVILQKLSFSTLPIFFLLLNRPVRRKITQFLRRMRRVDLASQGHVSTSTEKLSSDIMATNNAVQVVTVHHRPSARQPGNDETRPAQSGVGTTSV